MNNTKKPMAAQWSNPSFLKMALPSLREGAAKGDKNATENLNRLLEAKPELREDVEELDDLSTRVLKAWVAALVGDNKLSEKAIHQEVERLCAELVGDDPTLFDSVLVTNVIVSHLANVHASLVAAKPSDKPAVVMMRCRRAESAQRRLTSSLRSLALARNKLAAPPRLGRPPKSRD